MKNRAVFKCLNDADGAAASRNAHRCSFAIDASGLADSLKCIESRNIRLIALPAQSGWRRHVVCVLLLVRYFYSRGDVNIDCVALEEEV